jgi:hypothetical protein
MIQNLFDKTDEELGYISEIIHAIAVYELFTDDIVSDLLDEINSQRYARFTAKSQYLH